MIITVTILPQSHMFPRLKVAYKAISTTIPASEFYQNQLSNTHGRPKPIVKILGGGGPNKKIVKCKMIMIRCYFHISHINVNMPYLLNYKFIILFAYYRKEQVPYLGLPQWALMAVSIVLQQWQ